MLRKAVNKFRLGRLRGVLAGILVSASLTFPASAQTGNGNGGDQTEMRIAAALAGIQRFQSSHSVEDLRSTAHALYSAIDQRALRTGDVVGHRRSVVAGYAQVLAQIDALVDPTVDLTTLPSRCVTPPREPSGRQLPACADPKDITDAATRAQYVAALDANATKLQRRNAQARVQLAIDETTGLLEIVLHRFHNRAPSDAPALDEILRRYGLTDAQRSKIHAMY